MNQVLHINFEDFKVYFFVVETVSHKWLFSVKCPFSDMLTKYLYNILYTVRNGLTRASITALYIFETPKSNRLTAGAKFGIFSPYCR